MLTKARFSKNVPKNRIFSYEIKEVTRSQFLKLDASSFKFFINSNVQCMKLFALNNGTICVANLCTLKTNRFPKPISKKYTYY